MSISDMSVKVDFLSEVSTTDFTLEHFHIGVYEHVPLEITGRRCFVITSITIVLSVGCNETG